jgi:NhaA family Na+:H+ antiporter
VIFRSERHSSVILLAAAALGLLIANGALGPGVLALAETHVAIPGIGLDLTIGEWIADLLLAIFFFVVAVELKTEFRVGQLNSVRKAMVPAIAAAGGVLVPALLYLLIAGPRFAQGWPVPTATDIAFAVGVLATFGRHLPARMRIFLLALAVIDDVIGIALIALLFTSSLSLIHAAMAVVVGILIFVVGRMRRGSPRVRAVALVILALALWYAVYKCGIHPTIAGVAVGFLLPWREGERAAEAIAPWSAGVILPLFAFSASLVVIPAAGELGPVFFGLAIALPVGKAIGITLGGVIGALVARKHQSDPILGWDLLALAVTGGIGFTVALLMGQLAFRGDAALIDQSVLGVLVGSVVSMICGGSLIAWRSHVRRGARTEESADAAAGRVPSPDLVE